MRLSGLLLAAGPLALALAWVPAGADLDGHAPAPAEPSTSPGPARRPASAPAALETPDLVERVAAEPVHAAAWRPVSEEPREPLPWTDAQRKAAGEGVAHEGQRFAATRHQMWGALDPVEPGDARLALNLLDKRSGTPIRSKVELWRLDAPRNDYYGRGDQHVRELEVEREVVTVEGLAPGRYRIQAHAERFDSTSSGAFSVGPGHTAHSLFLDMPRQRAIHVRLHDAHGGEIREAVFRIDSRRGMQRPLCQAPGWVIERPLKRHPNIISIGGGCGGRFGGRRGWRKRTAGTLGFRIGQLTESSRAMRTVLSAEAKKEGFARLRMEVAGDDLACDRASSPVELAGVLVRREDVLASLILPDGRDGSVIHGWVDVWTEAVRVGDETDSASWRDVRVHIEVGHPDYAPLKDSYRVGDGLAPRYLRAREEDS